VECVAGAVDDDAVVETTRCGEVVTRAPPPPPARRDVELIFTNRDRGPLTRASFTHNAWKPALQRAGLERNRDNGMHALRHHYASVLLENGVSIRAVSEYLGHHDPGFTVRTHAHLMPESEDRARATIDAALDAPANPRGT
jgi:integrase